MAPREPTRAQLSSKLAYQSHTPSFLQKLQNRMNGIQEDEDEYEDEEFEHVGDGREPIPRRPRPAIPERPEGDPGSENEDDVDEKPQVVVLRAGKHLTEREAENVRRAEKGLPPLPNPETIKETSDSQESKSKELATSSSTKSTSNGLSFSSSSTAFKSKKRKAPGQLDELKFPELEEKKNDKDKAGGKKSSKKNLAKKAKKESKTLLSFGDDA
ncbi:hypothetical protein CPB83DRAFT_847114 [Crepidotus variabilis]|uniref:DUF4604 domain-containing protein n=1 Tax=Crepidotus variabilis TaxID=179855 RepID=A0A9P6EP22_9AGAR|nr:hypothetical protein CPB83DRAFT_847114 [Crepidotus variabilis]